MTELRMIIRRAVEKIGDPLMRHIIARTTSQGFTEEETRAEVMSMVKRSELRMKEDDIDHDWTYRKGRNW